LLSISSLYCSSWRYVSIPTTSLVLLVDM